LSSTVITWEAVAVLPQASVAVNVLVRVYSLAHAPLVVTSADVIVTAPQASLAVAVANDGVSGHSMVVAAGNALNTGGVLSSTVITWEAVAVLPQASVAVNVLVRVYSLAHAPLVVTSADVIVTAPQASLAVAVANDGVSGHSMVVAAGNALNTGGVLSSTVIIWEAVAVLPQASVAVNVLVRVYSLAHAPLVVTSADVIVTAPQASLAVAVANDGVSGHSMVVAAGNALNTGGVLSSTVITWEAVAVLPQASVAVNVLVRVYSLAHAPLVVTSADVIVTAPQASLAVAVANDGVSGHSMVVAAGNALNTGGVLSSTVITWEAVAVLPQASVAVNVLVRVYSLAHAPLVVTSADVIVTAPQASLAVAVANDGVSGHSMVVAAGNALNTGGVLSSTVIIWEAVAVLPQASVAVNVLVRVYSLAHAPLVVTSADVIVTAPQASLAVAVANDGVSGHSMVVAAGNALNTGGVLSSTVITWEAVAVLPQASVAVNVLVRVYSLAHAPLVVTSADVIVTAPQASLAVAVANDGVSGHSMVVAAGNALNTGGVLSSTVITWEAVAVLPQASVAVNVLVRVYSLAHAPLVVTSADVIVTAPQASLAVAVANDGVSGHSMVVAAGNALNTGGVLSSTVIIWEAVAVLPQASVAVNVLVRVYSLAHAPLVVTSADVIVTAPQASLAVAVANDGVSGHSMVVAAGNALNTGGVLSSTVITWEAVAVLPQASVAVNVLVRVYSLAHAPLVVTSADVIVTAPQASLAVAVANDGVSGHSMVVAAGNALNTGGVLSSTVIIWEAVAVLPQASVAVNVLVRVYSLAHAPLVVTSADVIVTAPQASLAVAVANDGVSGHAIVVAAGKALNTGGLLSSTVITWEAVAVLPQASVAVNVLVRVYSLAHAPLVVTSADVMVTAPQASDAVAVANDRVSGHSMVVAAGNALNTGGVLSSTVITWEAVAVLPQASVAVNVLVRVYSLAHAPLVVTSADVIVTAPQASLAVAVANDGVSGHSMVVAAGNALNTGGVLSSTVITWEAVAVLPQAS